MSDGRLAELASECARARAALDGFEARVLGEIERRGLAARQGAVNTAAWLAEQTGISEGAARGRVRIAGAVSALPEAGMALEHGELSSDHLSALARAIEEVGPGPVAGAEATLVEWGRQSSARRFARRLRRWVLRQQEKAGVPPDEMPRKQRRVSLGGDPVAGLGRLLAELPVDEFAIVTNVLWSLVEEQWRAERRTDEPMPRDEPTIPQRLADALVEMASRAAGATVGDRNKARPIVAVTIDSDTLMGRLAAAGRATLADGTPVPVEMARRYACEADIYPAVLGGESRPLDVGRGRRLATRHQRVAMLARSKTCEWPGCSVPAGWCQAHHLDPWESGGGTDIDNLAWMCNGHHHLAHEGGWEVERRADGAIHVSPPLAEADDFGSAEPSAELSPELHPAPSAGPSPGRSRAPMPEHQARAA